MPHRNSRTGRERYLARQWRTRDPNDTGLDQRYWGELGATWTGYLGDRGSVGVSPAGEAPWTDYLGNEPYVDYTVANVAGAPVATLFGCDLGIDRRVR